MAKVTLTPIPVQPIEKVTLELTPIEAHCLVRLLGNVGGLHGDSQGGKHLGAIDYALSNAGFTFHKAKDNLPEPWRGSVIVI